MYNKVFLVGNLGRDPEMRSLPSGQAVANFSLATSRRYTDRDGNRQEQTEWHQIVCFARLAEVAGQYLRKGRQIFVEGRIQTRSWDDRTTGEKRYRTEIICENFQMLGSRSDQESSGPADTYDYGQSAGSSQDPPDSPGGGASEAEAEDDDIPF